SRRLAESTTGISKNNSSSVACSGVESVRAITEEIVAARYLGVFVLSLYCLWKLIIVIISGNEKLVIYTLDF
ncbi:MAG: hypothetical protein KAJ92_05350, partial [Gammaproteobacteria bacterium]|nr:hypothetical protein [Gammaproteobacteria bacterium]